MTFPQLFYKSKDGAIIQWRVWSSGIFVMTEWGQIGGKLQQSSKKAEAKNVGRSNATSATQQAEIEVKAMHVAKLKRKYSATEAEAQEVNFLPMLAQDFRKHHNGLKYPVYVQPKLDGFRCLASKENGVVTLSSRSGDSFDLEHIQKELEQTLPDNTVVDGELYRHNTPFQKIASWIKKRHPESKTLQYHIYDIPESSGHTDLPMTDRVQLLSVLEKHKWEHICIVETQEALSFDDVLQYERLYVAGNYEGAIVRIPSMKYEYGHRSYGLLKVKSFSDNEYRVTNGRAGVGKMSDQCIFECVTSEGKKFNVVPMGTAEERRKYLKDLKKYVGKFLTVKYFGVSEENVPRFPVGKGFRPEKDLS